MIYQVSSQYICCGEPYDITATVNTYNQLSAQAQLDWLVGNRHCMCKGCLTVYEEEYSTHIVLPSGMPIYSMCVKR